MFAYLDFLFREEKTKNLAGRDFGQTESHFLQRDVINSELERKDFNNYDREDVRISIVHTRQDLILIVSILQRTNILLRWIRILLLGIVITLIFEILN